MKGKRSPIVALASILLFAAACGSGPPSDTTPVMGVYPRNSDGYADITVEQLVALLDEQDVTVVNVHIPFEGNIPQTDLSIPYDEVADHLDELPALDAPIVVYCRSGSMSTSAAAELAALGYSNVAELDGGMRAWQAAGHELEGQ